MTKGLLPCPFLITGLPGWHHFPATTVNFFNIIILGKLVYLPISLMPFVAYLFNVAGFCHNFQVLPTELKSRDA